MFSGIIPSQDFLARSELVRDLLLRVAPSVMCVFVGVTMLLLAWWRLGRQIERLEAPLPRDLAVTLGWWSAPLMLATPIFSRDVFSYLALGRMTSLHAPSWAYEQGPAYLGGPFAVDIPPIWQHTPAPYGPVFLIITSKLTWITQDSVRLGIIGMRLLSLLGIALMFWSVIRIARHFGVDPRRALWLGVLNPLVVLHLVADMHNDALMLGLMLAGVTLALDRRPEIGTVVITLAALIKVPAALALVFLIPIWARQLDEAGRWVRAVLCTAGITTLTVVATTAIAGTGYGWVGALDTPTLAHTWTSIATDLGHWTGRLAEWFDLATTEQTTTMWRVAGLLAAGLLTLSVWLRQDRYPPVVGLGLGFGAVVLLGPVLHPWYLTWAIVPLAAAATSQRLRRIVIFTTVAFTLLVLPGGVQPSVPAFLGAALGAAAVYAAVGLTSIPVVRRVAGSVLEAGRHVLQREPVALDAEPADHTRGYRRDDRLVPERFAGVDVGDVDLHERSLYQGAGIAQRVRVMRPRAGVEYDRGVGVRSFVQPTDHLVLGVRLPHLRGETQLLTDTHAHLGELGIGDEPVDVGLPRAKPTKIRSIQYVDLHDDTSW
jgi:Glycosyltransferase family 87